MIAQLKKAARGARRLFRSRARRVIEEVRARRLTYLSPQALEELYDCVARIEKHRLDGVLIEAGCALGGSAIVAATAKTKARPFFIYDVFGMIPPPSEADGEDVHQRYETIVEGHSKGIGADRYYGYEENLYDKVVCNFEHLGIPPGDNRIHLVKGLFEETMQIEEPVAFAHIDGDWYQSVMTCLRQIEPRLVPGGVLVIDDYDSWSGCRKAVDEYFADKREHYRFVNRSRLHIVRVANR